MVLGKLLQLLVDGVQAKLIVVEQQQVAGLLQRDLATQFAADTSARPSDQHHPAFEALGQQTAVWWDWVAPQQIFDLLKSQETPG